MALLSTMQQCVQRVLMTPCVADRLCRVLNIICYHPMYATLVILVSYLIFVLLFSPFYILSYLIYPFGALLVFLGCIVALARYIARCMIFPGHVQSYQKQVSTEVIKQLIQQWVGIYNTSVSLCLNIQHILAPPPTANSPPLYRPQDVTSVLSLFPSHLRLLLSITDVAASLPPPDNEIFSSLLTSLQDIYADLQRISALLPAAPALHRAQILSLPLISRQELLAEIKTCARSCKGLHESIASATGRVAAKQDSSSNGSPLQQLKQLYTLLISSTSPIAGLPTLAFPLLRSQLFLNYSSATRLSIPVTSKWSFSGSRTIDAVYISNPTTSSDKLALLCNPNAGFYECLAMAQDSRCWLNYYQSRGFNVCLFNYSGYSSSTGLPSPDIVKEDGLAVARHILQQYSPSYVVVHGESIGGMVASHIASQLSVNMLVCDRTFHSLNAVAARMLGNQLALALDVFGRWKSDVYIDFSSFHGKKLIIQDPKDEIISYSSSLAVGVAAHALLGTCSYCVPSLSPGYSTALYNRTPPPVPQKTLQWLSSVSVAAPPVIPISIPSAYRSRYTALTTYSFSGCLSSLPFYQHFAACLLHLQQRAQLSADTRGQRTRSASEPDVHSCSSDDIEEGGTTMRRSNSETTCAYQSDMAMSSTHERIWRLFSRCHAGNLYTLQSAVMREYDGVLAWVCYATHWGNSGNMLQALHDYTVLVEKEVSNDEVHIFAAAALEEILEWQQNRSSRKDIALVDVHCGHNGWPADEEIGRISLALEQLMLA